MTSMFQITEDQIGLMLWTYVGSQERFTGAVVTKCYEDAWPRITVEL